MINKVNIPEGKFGEWSIEKFKVDDLGAFRSALNCIGRRVPVGEYTRLVREGKVVVMSDTPAEMADHYEFIRLARGDVLINGLGIGMCLGAVLDKPEVTSVTVVELSKELIDWVAPCYAHPKLTVIHMSAFDFKPNKRYGAVWHDIWDTISEENLSEMGKLHRKFGRWTDWQGSWCKAECQRLRKRDQMYENMFNFGGGRKNAFDN